jgi:hypothetical protein
MTTSVMESQAIPQALHGKVTTLQMPLHRPLVISPIAPHKTAAMFLVNLVYFFNRRGCGKISKIVSAFHRTASLPRKSEKNSALGEAFTHRFNTGTVISLTWNSPISQRAYVLLRHKSVLYHASGYWHRRTHGWTLMSRPYVCTYVNFRYMCMHTYNT